MVKAASHGAAGRCSRTAGNRQAPTSRGHNLYVRIERRTGSAAEFHAAPIPDPLPWAVAWVFELDRAALVLGSRQREEAATCKPPVRPGPRSCVVTAAVVQYCPGEVIVASRKVVGISQRRTRIDASNPSAKRPIRERRRTETARFLQVGTCSP